MSEQIIEAKPENIAKNEADENVSVSDVEDKQEDISDIDTDTKVEAGAEDKPEGITVKQDKKDKGEKKPVSKSKGKKKSKLDELKAQYKKVKPYIPMGWKYFKKLLKAIRFTDTRIVLDVGKEDAYEAAMLYGKVQAGLFNTIAILAGVFTVKLKKADVNCIFDEKKFGYDVHTLVRVRPSTLIAIGFCTGVNFLKIYLSGRRKKKRAAKRRSKELAAKKNEVDMALGNVIGSNIFNILLVLGVAGAISPVAFVTENLIDIAILVVMSVVVWIFAWSKKKLVNWHGAVMLVSYVAYLVYICIR